MPRRPERIAKSSSRSSKKGEPSATPQPRPGSTVAVARVSGPHGIRGLLRARPYHLPCSSLVAGARVLLAAADGRQSSHVVIRAAPHGGDAVLLALEGVGDRDAAARLAGAEVLVDAGSLPPAGEGEFYYHEMPGFLVETTDGSRIGEITGTMHTGTTDVWIVRAEGREILIPVVRDVVQTIDRAARRIRITPLPGLLD